MYNVAQGIKTLREERKQRENSLGGYVHAVWSGAGPGPSQLGWNRWSGEAERLIAPSGELGAVEQVEPGSAVVDEGGLAVAWQEFTVRAAKSSMSVSSVTRRESLPFKIHTCPSALESLLPYIHSLHHSHVSSVHALG